MSDDFIDNEMLISLVEQKPVLWDKTMDLYKNRVATRAAWKKILTVLNPDFERRKEKERQAYAKLVIQRWTHIRDTYSRSYKKIKDQKRSGNGAKRTKPYIYSKKMRFLQKIIQPNKSVNNVITEDAVVNTESEEQEINSETEEEENNDTVTKTSTPKRIPKRPLKNDIIPVDSRIIEFMNTFSTQEPKVNNRHLSFFNGILPTLDAFDDNEVLDFQMGVLQLLKKIKSSRQNKQFIDVN